MSESTIYLFRPEDKRFDPAGNKQNPTRGWETLRDKFSSVADVKIIENDTGYLYARDPFVIVGNTAYYAAGIDGSQPWENAASAIRDYAKHLQEQGVTLKNLNIENKSHTQGGNVVIDTHRNTVYIGTAGRELKQNTFETLKAAIEQDTGMALVGIRTSGADYHLDTVMGVLPTGDIYVTLDQNLTRHVKPGDMEAALSGSGVKDIQPLIQATLETGHQLFVGLMREPIYEGGGMRYEQGRRVSAGKRTLAGYEPVDDLIKNRHRYIEMFAPDHVKPVDLTSDENRHIGVKNMSSNFVTVGDTVFAQEMPVELIDHLQSSGFNVDITPEAHYDSVGAVRCLTVVCDGPICR